NIEEVDDIMQQALIDSIFPGAVILTIKDNEILYYKTFGTTSYDSSKTKVNRYTIYDLASLTKPLATTLAIMKLYENNKIDLQASISKYLPELRSSSIGKIKIDRIMTHTAGLPPFINFYELFSQDKYPDLYSKTSKADYHQVADSIYVS